MKAKPAAQLGDRDLGKTVQATGTLTAVVTSARWVDVTVRVGVGDVVEVGDA